MILNKSLNQLKISDYFLIIQNISSYLKGLK